MTVTCCWKRGTLRVSPSRRITSYEDPCAECSSRGRSITSRPTACAPFNWPSNDCPTESALAAPDGIGAGEAHLSPQGNVLLRFPLGDLLDAQGIEGLQLEVGAGGAVQG